MSAHWPQLRIQGDDLLPDHVTHVLGAKPTTSQTKGEALRSKSGIERVAKRGSWQLDAPETEPADLDLQVSAVLARLSTDLVAWRQLAERYEIDFFCGWFMGQGNEGVTLRPSTLLALGERGIELAVDLYGPTSDA